MKSTELRIGNLVDLHGQEDYRVIGLDRKFITVKYKNHETTDDGSNLLPVPITEEWLLKFGFIKDGEEFVFIHLNAIVDNSYERKDYKLIEDTFLEVWYLKELDYEYSNLASLFYIHELQNLYFALTGLELEIK